MEKNITVCITTHNEAGNIKKLLNSLLKQSKKPFEIIIVDSGSSDGTQDVVKSVKSRTIKLFVVSGCSRSEGRNFAVGKSKTEIIAFTDAGVVADKDWLKNLAAPFADKKVKVVAGFYKMVFKNNLQKSMSTFLGVVPEKFDDKFLPSARSLAILKTVFKKIGGFPKDLNGTAEDTKFNLNIIENRYVIARNKEAVVFWIMPKSIFDFSRKIFNYALGDVKSKIWWHPIKKFNTHNIKALSVFLRYLFFVSMFFIDTRLFLVFILLYSGLSFSKAGLWGMPLQFVSDFSIMLGFLYGLITK